MHEKKGASMITYKYSFFARLLYRYGNIPLTLLLLVYLAMSVIGLLSQWYFIFFVAVNSTIIIWLNRYYIRTYKIFPFTISADNEKLICSDFLMSPKIIEIPILNIDKITGGIFSGYPTRPTYIHDAEQNVTIGFYSNAGSFNELLMTVIKNVNEKLYQQLIEKIKKLRDGK